MPGWYAATRTMLFLPMNVGPDGWPVEASGDRRRRDRPLRCAIRADSLLEPGAALGAGPHGRRLVTVVPVHQREQMPTKTTVGLERVVVRFAGDSGDGMQLTGD